MTRLDPSPGSFLESDMPVPAPARHRAQVTNVQRWKVLRDRNRNLPKLDFNYKTTGGSKIKLSVPRVAAHESLAFKPNFRGQQHVEQTVVMRTLQKSQTASFPGGFYNRSHTQDSIKLPSLTAGSSHVTGTIDNSDFTKRRDQSDTRGNIQETGSLVDLSHQGGLHNISSPLSKSLNNLTESPEDTEPNTKHRYQRIACCKVISKRRGANKAGTGTKTGVSIKEESANKIDALNKPVILDNVGDASVIKHSKDVTLSTANRDVTTKGQQRQPHTDSDTKHSTKKDKDYHVYKENPVLSKHAKRTKVPRKLVNETSELNLLEKSGMYQVDLTSWRHEIPPLSNPPSSAQTERCCSNSRDKYVSPPTHKRSRGTNKGRRQKWRDNCNCLRCGMMKRQYADGDDAYRMWGKYPCIHMGRRTLIECLYDSD